MLKLSLLSALVFTCSISYSQEQIKLTPNSSLQNSQKSNATLLKESQSTTTKGLHSDDLSKKYKATHNEGGTFRSTNPNTVSPNSSMTTETNMYNAKSYQQKLGNGVKANSTIYTDESGKIRSSNTSIKLGK